MSFSDYLEKKLLDEVTGKTEFTLPVIYIGLSVSTPTDAGANIVEPATGGTAGYVRYTTSAGDWLAATAGQAMNAAALSFPQATSAWGTITAFFASDALTGGNMLWYGDLSTARTVNNGDTASFAVSSLVVTLD